MKLNSWLLLISLTFGCNLLKKDSGSKNEDLLLLLALIPRGYQWNLPPGFPIPVVPAENPMSQEKVDLGRFLFFDSNLSQDRSLSCGGCHKQSLAFSDGRQFGIGITGEAHPRNAQGLANAAYHPRLTWSNPQQRTLESQSRTPMFGTTPIELGLSNDEYLSRLKADSRYIPLFSAAFGGGADSVTEQNVRFALASFQRTMISGGSPFDHYNFRGNTSALTASQIRGLRVFNGEVAECFHCHGGFNFTDTSFHSQNTTQEVFYHNNGTHTKVYYDALSIEKQGLREITLVESDQGKFRAPSLRNVGVTFPYMHDGSIMCDNNANPNHASGIAAGATNLTCARNALTKVVEQYSCGGVGAGCLGNSDPKHPSIDTTLIRPFTLTAQEKTDLVEFLLSLTDSEFLSNPSFSSPF
ncbi:di-heme enzyme [Leptospira idonii]|uniref:Di-heme enzyme n=2 Tax=Leptospira idonii TaxID=1193500 RepID=A0A4R9M1F7_9LEPT|nr:MbnH family di-heme enzyme [Leptospira idonii]TGN19801.1 di-heme enzyme [Leptospira idonii]